MTKSRRSLTFAALDDVMPEVEGLLRGHVTVGNWSLGQICSHLTRAVHCTIDGFPPATRMPWIVRRTLGRMVLWHILRRNRFVEWMPAPADCQPKLGVDAVVEAEALRAALQRFAAHSGPLAEQPLYGPVDRAVWERFHCIHCAHHLGFAVPVKPEKE